MSKWNDPEWVREYNRKRYQANRERILEKRREHYRASPTHRQQKAEARRKWAENKGAEGMREYHRDYYARNREKRIEQATVWRRNRKHREIAKLMRGWCRHEQRQRT